MKEDNLDKLFQEKLTDFQEQPDHKVWSSIEASLNKKDRSRKVVPLWWKLGGIAAILAILFVAIDPFSTTNAVDPILTDVENRDAKENANDKAGDKTDEIFNDPMRNTPSVTTVGEDDNKDALNAETRANPISNDAVTTGDHQKGKAANFSNRAVVGATGVVTSETKKQVGEALERDAALENIKGAHEDRSKSPNGLEISKTQELAVGAVPQKLGDNKLPTTPEAFEDAMDPKKKSILDDIENGKEMMEVAKTQGGRWSAGPSVAPVYFNGIGGGSPINSILASNTKTGNVTLSYGLTVAYEVSKRVSIRSGIHKVDYGYNTNDVSFTSSFNASSNTQLENINYNNTAQSIVLSDTRNQLGVQQSDMQVAYDFTGKSPTRMGTMGQQIGYVEVPLEVNYALLDSKFGVNLIGGLSSLFLTDNVVVLQSSGQTTELGEANNINGVNFSTNIGLGLDYKFNTKLKLKVEPVFKYQLNTFNDTSGSFNPYSLGVYSGFSFKF